MKNSAFSPTHMLLFFQWEINIRYYLKNHYAATVMWWSVLQKIHKSAKIYTVLVYTTLCNIVYWSRIHYCSALTFKIQRTQNMFWHQRYTCFFTVSGLHELMFYVKNYIPRKNAYMFGSSTRVRVFWMIPVILCE